MTPNEVFKQTLIEIYGDKRTHIEFAAEYSIAVRHVKRLANGYRAVPQRMLTWLAMRKKLGQNPNHLPEYKAIIEQVDDPESLPD